MNDQYQPRIIAYHPDIPTRFLISAPDQVRSGGETVQMGRILDLAEKELYPPHPLLTFYARTPWESYTGEQSILPGMLTNVRVFDA